MCVCVCVREGGAENCVMCYFSQVMVERPQTWKKLSAVSQASASDGNMAVKLQRSYHRNDEDETEVDLENVAKGGQYLEERSRMWLRGGGHTMMWLEK